VRIALVCEYFYPDNSGGTPTDMSELAQYLKQRYAEVEIEVLTSRNLYRPTGEVGSLLAREVWRGLRIRRFRTPKSNRPSMALRLLAGGVFSMTVLAYLLRHRSYDLLLVVTNPPANALAAWFYCKLRGVPYVYFINDLYPDIAVALGRLSPQSRATKFFGWFQKRWLHAAARTAVVGRCMQDHIHSRYALPLARIAVIRNWADAIQIRPLPRDNAVRRAENLSGLVVLYGGNFSRYVNFDQILAAAKLLRQNPDITFVLIGDGTRRAEILERVEKAALKNVRVLPPVPRSAMGEVLAASDVCLISLAPQMKGLGVPGKLYSILAAGRPVMAVVPMGSEVARVLEEEQCGVNVADGDAEALARAITRLKQEDGLIKRMGQNARSALERRFTLPHAAEQFYGLFKEVLAGKGRTVDPKAIAP
jgi:glycosyltransferase involved in cell wall biosynthesis